ncbi:MAG TPA: pyridoxal-phosphate dependent enzyme [Chthoniobacterales bacterium]|nr:pyridoxal-phosphate dependent enzyme [Chthoniobacterales bacterium]
MSLTSTLALNLDRIRAAHERIRAYIHRTPVLTSSRLDEASGVKLFFKCENFQKVGAFKARGATNAVFVLDDTSAKRGVVTHSSGNHGTAVAHAAKLRKIPARIVMPKNSTKVKLRAVETYGADIVFCEATQEAREATCAALIAETGATLIHPFENEDVMAGQGTAAIELLEEADIDLLLCPIGGGGLLCGTAIAAKSMQPKIKVIAVEPANADDAAKSFRAGKRIVTKKNFTIADGLRTNVGERNFPIIQRYVNDVVTVSEEAIASAMRTIWETMKIVIEPSAAVPYAAILEEKIDTVGKRVGIILTGGNVDLEALPWMRA